MTMNQVSNISIHNKGKGEIYSDLKINTHLFVAKTHPMMCSYCENQLLRQIKHISWFLTFTTFSLVIIVSSLHFRWLFSIDIVLEWFKCFPSVFLLQLFRSSLIARFITVWPLGESLQLIHF